jgi:uncharacterized delta-60 repeat protein
MITTTNTVALALILLALPAGVAQADAGDLDPTFDGDGKRTVNYGGADRAVEVLVQSDSKILVAGHGGPDENFTVSRLNPDGSLDTVFGDDGTAVADFGGIDMAYAAALQSDGKILVAGTTDSEGMAIARFLPGGALDASFDPGGADGDGKKVFGSREQTQISGIVVQPDGRIVVVSSHTVNNNPDFAVTRLKPDGSPDGTSFADADFGGQDTPNAVSLQPNGKIVVAGVTWSPTSPRMAVARYDVDGTLDETFGGTGKVAFGAGSEVAAKAVRVRPDGKIVVAGYGGALYDVVVVRLNPDGTFDATFGTGGTSEVAFGLFGLEAAYAAALLPDGRIVVAGAVAVSVVDVDFAVARLGPGGALDLTFSADGRTTVGFGAGDFANAVAVQADGRIVVAGATQPADDIAVARLEGVTPPPAGGAGDRTAPILSRFSASPHRFRARRASSAAAKRPRRGTTLTLELSEPATVRFDAFAVSRGRRVGARCRKPTRANRKRRRCTLSTRKGGFSRAVGAGRSKLAFSGRVGKRALSPARYTLRATPKDAAGNSGERRAVALRIVR